MKPVLVTWVDSTQSEPGWQDIDDVLNRFPVPIQSVGFLVDKSVELITLANSYDDEAQTVEGVSTIPMVSILSIKDLS